MTAFPDWFHSNTQGYWDDEFASFFDAETGVDIDALWIDMNEPSNFCEYPCDNPGAEGNGIQDGIGQVSKREPEANGVAAQVNTPRFVHRGAAPRVKYHKLASRQENGTKKGLPGRDLIDPAYKIKNDFGSLSSRSTQIPVWLQADFLNRQDCKYRFDSSGWLD